MEKYISFYFGYPSNYAERISLIKESGFDGVMAMYRFSDTFFDECELCKKVGLKIDSLHLPFRNIANRLWQSDESSQVFLNSMKEGIDFAAKESICQVVVHTTSTAFPPPKNKEGIKRILALAEYAMTKNIFLCIENLRRSDYFEYILEHDTDRILKICFDSGHANAFHRGGIPAFPLEKLHERITCCHLHDNNGRYDSHRLPFDGTTDWNALCQRLAKCENLRGLTLETCGIAKNRLPSDEYAFLCEGYRRLLQIEQSIKETNHATRKC